MAIENNIDNDKEIRDYAEPMICNMADGGQYMTVLRSSETAPMGEAIVMADGPAIINERMSEMKL